MGHESKSESWEMTDDKWVVSASATASASWSWGQASATVNGYYDKENKTVTTKYKTDLRDRYMKATKTETATYNEPQTVWQGAIYLKLQNTDITRMILSKVYRESTQHINERPKTMIYLDNF